MKQGIFSGCGTALVTPFLMDGSVDWDSLDRLVEAQLAGGVNCLVAAGTTGEPATMTREERLAVIRRVVQKAAGRVPVIAGTGGNNTREVIEEARLARECGADAQLCVTPYYNKTTQAGLIAHYHAIADDGALPVVVYNVPSRTGMNIAPATLQAICRHENVIAVKEANPDVGQALEKLRLCGGDAAFYSGNDDLTWPLMACGFQGVISLASNLVPEKMTALTAAALRGDCAEAARLQMELQPLNAALFCETSPIPVKAAMAMLDRAQDVVRLPLVPMQPENRKRMEQVLRDMGLVG